MKTGATKQQIEDVSFQVFQTWYGGDARNEVKAEIIVKLVLETLVPETDRIISLDDLRELRRTYVAQGHHGDQHVTQERLDRIDALIAGEDGT